MDLWILALAGTALLAGTFVCLSRKKKTGRRIFDYLTIVLGAFSALCFFCCAATLLLTMGIE